MTTLRKAWLESTHRLAEAGVEDAEREASWLLAHVMNCSVGALRSRLTETLPAEQVEALARLVMRRAAREPIQYVLGTAEFLGMTFRVTPAVLIPRQDTETLVEAAAGLLHGPVRVADIGTGSGAIAIGLARLLPEAKVVAVDISPEALGIARENAVANHVADRVQFRQGDLTAPLAGAQFDAILSNPPYIDEGELAGLMPEVRDWEPKIALTPGPDGYVLYRRLLTEAPPLLAPHGFLAVEVGLDQAPTVAALFDGAGLTVTVHEDRNGVQRVVIGRKGS